MEILIKAEEMNEEELRAQFNVIKLAAYNRKPLPEDFEPDSIDLDYAEKVKRVYNNYRLQIQTEEESKHIIDRYFNNYKTEKAVFWMGLESAKAILETRKKTGQLTKQMIDLDFSTYSEAESLLQKLFEITLDGVTASELQRTFVQYLKTGCKPKKEVTDDDQHDSSDGQACA